LVRERPGSPCVTAFFDFLRLAGIVVSMASGMIGLDRGKSIQSGAYQANQGA
jgi:hypothetical protein